jgi:sugar/nucleoside kinase (ribokinase family)
MLYRPAQLITEAQHLRSLRSAIGIADIPVIVWEPFPALCSPENLQAHIEACKVVDVFSPNHLELLGLFDRAAEVFDAKTIELCARKVLNETKSTTTSKRHHAVVVRAGENGCHVVSQDSTFWLPPFHTDDSNVVDATGGGNTFLGAFAVTLASTCDLRAAAIAGSVAASFAIEQIGLPHLTTDQSNELWNKKGVQERSENYNARLRRLLS